MAIAPLFALFGAGLFTFASPCVLPLLPLYLGVLAGANGGKDPSAWRLRLAGIGFALGLGLVFVLLGASASALASTLTTYERPLGIMAGVVMALFGLKLLGVLRLPGADREARPLLSRVPNLGGFFGGFLFGGAFAVGWTPCVGPVLGAALSYAATSTSSPAAASVMLGAYALGLATPLVLASFAASQVLRFTRRLNRYTPLMGRVTGGVMVAAGLLFVATKLDLYATPHPDSSCSSEAAVACEAGADVGSAPVVDVLPKGPVLIQFTSSHCPVCQKMGPLMAKLAERCSSTLVQQVNIDQAEGRALARHYGVRQVPTFLSVDHAGAEVVRAVGEQSEQALLTSLSEVRGAPCVEL